MNIEDIPREYLISFGKDSDGNDQLFIKYKGLLDIAHKKGLDSIEVKLGQIPSAANDNTAICKATLKAGDKYFIDYGDANNRNVGRLVAAHIIRMASTRAKARVLRDFTGIGIACFDEIDGESEEKKSKKSSKNKKSEATSQQLPDYMTKEQSNELNTIAQFLVDNFLARDLAGAKKKISEMYNLNMKTTKEEAEHVISDLKKKYYQKETA